VARVLTGQAEQMAFAEHDHMVEQLSAQGPDELPENL
jgi:hypothetical protein